MINTIIFDIGNVLGHFNCENYLNTFSYTIEIKEALGFAHSKERD